MCTARSARFSMVRYLAGFVGTTAKVSDWWLLKDRLWRTVRNSCRSARRLLPLANIGASGPWQDEPVDKGVIADAPK